MRKEISFLCICLALILGFPSIAYADMDCSDFSSQEEAQQYFEDYGGSAFNNVDGLDRDHDGIACESLPSGGYSGGNSNLNLQQLEEEFRKNFPPATEEQRQQSEEYLKQQQEMTAGEKRKIIGGITAFLIIVGTILYLARNDTKQEIKK